MIKDIRLTESISCEGYLRKEQPNFLKLYQKRFYTIMDKGNLLVWFDKKPSNPDKIPKGIINIPDIHKIEVNEKEPDVFMIFYPERTFILKAESPQERDKWVSALSYIIQFKKKHTETVTNTSMADKKNGWRWSYADQNTLSKVQLENERHLIEDAQQEDTSLSVEKSKEIMLSKKLVTNIGNQEMMDRIIGGFLLKKGKLANLTQFKTRWFFMVSDCNLRNIADKRRLILKESASWVKINTIYYFEPKSENQEFRGNIRLSDVQELSLDLSETPFKLIIKTEKREYTFGSRYLSEINRWEGAINAVIGRWKAEKEYQQNRIRNFKAEETILFEGDIKYNDMKAYIIVKSNALAVLKQQDSYKVGQTTLVQYKDLATSQQNKEELRISSDIDIRVMFETQSDCERVQRILLPAQKQLADNKKREEVMEEKIMDVNVVQKVEDPRSTYLGRRLLEKQKQGTKNFYTLYDMEMSGDAPRASTVDGEGTEIVPKPPAKPPQQLGFFARLERMFCGGSTD